MVNHHKLPARHACALVGLSRDTYRHESQASALNLELRDQIIQTAHARRRWGYRMIHDVLRPQYPGINHKRVYRIYTAEGLSGPWGQVFHSCILLFFCAFRTARLAAQKHP
jgi:putative transposase